MRKITKGLGLVVVLGALLAGRATAQYARPDPDEVLGPTFEGSLGDAFYPCTYRHPFQQLGMGVRVSGGMPESTGVSASADCFPNLDTDVTDTALQAALTPADDNLQCDCPGLPCRYAFATWELDLFLSPQDASTTASGKCRCAYSAKVAGCDDSTYGPTTTTLPWRR